MFIIDIIIMKHIDTRGDDISSFYNKAFQWLSHEKILQVLTATSHRDKRFFENLQHQYLQYAPIQFKKLWKKSTPEDMIVYMKYIEFTQYWPNIIGESGEQYELSCNNLGVPNSLLKKWEIEKEWDTTYFSFDAMQTYTLENTIFIPTKDMYMDMLTVMPAWDIVSSWQWWVAGEQLFSIIGSPLSWYRNGSDDRAIKKHGYLWSSTLHTDKYANAFALKADTRKGTLKDYARILLLPVRTLRNPK